MGYEPSDVSDIPEQNESPGDPRFDDWPVAGDRYQDASYVGTTTGGTPVYHHEGTSSIFHGRVDGEEERIVPDADSVTDLDPGETIADAIEIIGDELGWETLSEFGRTHSGDADDGRPGDDGAANR